MFLLCYADKEIKMSERPGWILRWNEVYDNLTFVKEWVHGTGYTSKILMRIGTDQKFFLIKFNNVTYHHDSVTVFDFLGTAYSGRNNQFNLKIYELPNGTVNAEVYVIKR